MATIPVATAMAYLAAGLSCLPASKAKKRPDIKGGWSVWQSRLPTEIEVRAWFANAHDAISVVTGSISGNLECIDFDNRGELFEAWKSRITSDLFARLVVESTQSGGFHVFYRSESNIGGNKKLARGMRHDEDGRLVEKTLIETRGKGGQVVCAPSDGYTAIQGDLTSLPILSPIERQSLLDAARSLDEIPAAPAPTIPTGANSGDFCAVSGDSRNSDRWERFPGDDYNERGDFRSILQYYGWQYVRTRPDGNEDWTRPGKDPKLGISATFKDGCFYVFSTDAAPFEPNIKYSPFAIYATLCHHGNFTAAAGDLAKQGFGKAKSSTDGVTLNLHTPNGEQGSGSADDEPLSIDELLDGYPTLRPVIIDGFLRQGEIMNIIAAPKTGKSWFVLALALHVATGRDWLGHTCKANKVLIIDNELHRETYSQRLKVVMEAMGVSRSEARGRIEILPLRGKWTSLEYIGSKAEKFKDKGYGLIIVDAFYRALPKGTVENDNGAITDLYNMLDRFASQIGCSFALIHHTSKGNQSMKSVTDVGAGAGSQSRAADTHMTLREHKDDGYLVLESVVRSFPKQEPIVLKKAFPLMIPDYGRNPEDLAGKAELGIKKDDPPAAEIAQRLVELVDSDHPQAKGVFVDTVRVRYGIMEKTARLAVDTAIADGVILCGRLPNQPRGMQATKFIHLPTPEQDDDEDE